MKQELKAFVVKNRFYILISLAVYALITVVLILLSADPESVPFVYQIF